jgi:outer membrane lipoprotein-sorting protein
MCKTALLACAIVLGAPFLFAQGKAPKTSSAKAEQLPSGESVMDRFVEVVGGVDAHKKIKSSIVRGTLSVPMMGMSAPITIYRASPNLMLNEVDMPGLGKMLEGCDGTNVWGYNALTGPSLKKGRAAEDALDEAMFDDYNWRAKYASAETKGVEKIEGEDCYKVELARRTGGGTTTLVTGAGRADLTEKSGSPHVQYFSKKTGLMVKLEAETEMEMGKLQMTVVPKDYRKVGGIIMMPFELTNTVAGQTMTIAYTEMELNADIPKSKFDPPEEVRALLAEEAAAAAKATKASDTAEE